MHVHVRERKSPRILITEKCLYCTVAIAQFRHLLGNVKYPKKLNTYLINDKFEVHVPCASFEEKCEQTRSFFNTSFNMRGIYFRVHGKFVCIFVRYVVIIFWFLKE